MLQGMALQALALLFLGLYLVVLFDIVLEYAPRPGRRRGFRRAALRARHSLVDWDASHRATDDCGSPT